MNTWVPWRIPLERDLSYLLELDDNVDAYEPLPHRVAIKVGEKQRFHFPSFQVRSHGRIGIIDAVPLRREDDPDRNRLNRLLASMYRDRGILYQALPSSVIRAEPRFRNAQQVLGCRSFIPRPRLEYLVTQVLSDGTPRTLDDLVRALPRESHAGTAICRMVLDGKLSICLVAPSPGQMRVSLRQRKTDQ
jgi:hypothetical protein